MSKQVGLEPVIAEPNGAQGELPVTDVTVQRYRTFAPVTDATVSRHDAVIAVTDGARCYGCGHEFDRSEVAFRARGAHRGRESFGRGWAISLKLYCAKCRPLKRPYTLPAPCVACGRQVAREGDYIRRKRVVCSPECGRRADVIMRARHRAAKHRKICATCGSEFIGTRADATTCGAACRQKAYRRRIAAREIGRPA